MAVIDQIKDYGGFDYGVLNRLTPEEFEHAKQTAYQSVFKGGANVAGLSGREREVANLFIEQYTGGQNYERAFQQYNKQIQQQQAQSTLATPTPSATVQPTTVQTPTGMVSTAFPERYAQTLPPKSITLPSQFETSKIPRKETMQNYGIPEYKPENFEPFFPQPTVYSRQKGTITDMTTGKQIPLIEYSYTGGLLPQGKYGLIEQRPATQEEIKQLQESTRVLMPSKTPHTRTGEIIGVVSQDIYQANVGGSQFIEQFGINEKSITKGATIFSHYATAPIEVVSPPARKTTEQFLIGATSGPLVSAYKSPVTTVAIVGTGAGLGLVAESIPLAASTISPMAGTIAKGGVLGTGLVLGGIYTVSKGSQFLSATSERQAGEVFGGAISEVGLFALGYKGGTALAQKGYGYFSTLGRTEVPIEELVPKDVLSGEKTFIESSSYGFKGGTVQEKQAFDVKVFQEKGYGYHATPTKFFKETIEIVPGTSEVKGSPYLAPDLSVYFLKTNKEYFPEFKDILNVNRPAAAKVYTSFETAPIIKEAPRKYSFGGQIKPGVAYVTGIKPETEALFPYEQNINQPLVRVDKSLYFEYGGRRIPLDVFKSSSATKESLRTLQSGGISKADVFKSESYSLPTREYNVPYLYSQSVSIISYPSGSVYKSITASISKPSVSSYKPSMSKPSISYVSPSISKPSTSLTPSYTPSVSRPSGSYYNITGGGSSSGISGPSKSFPPYVPPFSGMGFGETYKKRKVKRKKPKYRYQASLTSGLLGITSTKMPKKYFGGYSPLSRPILVSPRRRKSSRRRKRR